MRLRFMGGVGTVTGSGSLAIEQLHYAARVPDYLEEVDLR